MRTLARVKSDERRKRQKWRVSDAAVVLLGVYREKKMTNQRQLWHSAHPVGAGEEEDGDEGGDEDGEEEVEDGEEDEDEDDQP
jgi:hypothetical protein